MFGLNISLAGSYRQVMRISLPGLNQEFPGLQFDHIFTPDSTGKVTLKGYQIK